MTMEWKHINVCVCTFKRPVLLRRLLNELDRQRTDGLFNYSAVVVDNDHSKSAQDVIRTFQQTSNLDVLYCVEPEQSIALARNKAVENANGNFVAFIDDDEFPDQNWLLNLFKAYNEYKADGILGPVLPYYETKPAVWIIKGKFHERPSHESGTILPWNLTRTGNVLLRRDIFVGKDNMFRPEFGSGGEDRDFFRRMIKQGYKFVWCAEAPVFEVVPPERCRRSFMLRRALLRGKTPYNHSIFAYLKSLVAIPVYTLLLPILIFMRHHIFMKYLISYFDHIGRILYLGGVSVIKEKYIME
jgi:succinoglycan biosynthesis protein ExoM